LFHKLTPNIPNLKQQSLIYNFLSSFAYRLEDLTLLQKIKTFLAQKSPIRQSVSRVLMVHQFICVATFDVSYALVSVREALS
jgi:hypothetical protein